MLPHEVYWQCKLRPGICHLCKHYHIFPAHTLCRQSTSLDTLKWDNNLYKYLTFWIHKVLKFSPLKYSWIISNLSFIPSIHPGNEEAVVAAVVGAEVEVESGSWAKMQVVARTSKVNFQIKVILRRISNWFWGSFAVALYLKQNLPKLW